ncbi:MAG: manganese efflux pump [Bacteroidales bacterium]|nr:manganese efflux pump [Bacteroidales bacterium]
MNFLTIISLAIALSMDSFSVSICKGLNTKSFSVKTALSCGLWFGGFQALMPLIGYFFGYQFESLITNIDHWIAFGLLFLIGANMIREAFEEEKDNDKNKNNTKTMFLLAVATSIDALAVGVTFAFLMVEIWRAILIIGVTTFLFSFAGVAIGNFFGAKYSKPASIIGGIILILIGTKILLEHLNIL